MIDRNRSEGWKHAKISGHENEDKVENLLQNNSSYQLSFLKRIGKPEERITNIKIGGLHEKNVPCIFNGETTKSKTDMYVTLSDGSNYNISIKKSLSGQVYLIGIDRFIKGFEMQYDTIIPDNIKRAISLFWGSAPDTIDIVNKFGTSQKEYETRKHRLTAYTLRRYNNTLYDELLTWFRENIYNISDFCFSKGLAKNPEDWANVIWYKNEIGETSVDDIYLLDDLCTKIQKNSVNKTFYGNIGGGTTIQLPFGFVQWHSPSKKIPGDMQFHHKHDEISNLL
jgi:hypothetical protein